MLWSHFVSVAVQGIAAIFEKVVDKDITMHETNGNGNGIGTLAGKCALAVTGASRGIGHAIALGELARRGADVAVNYNAALYEAEEVVKEICAMGRRALFWSKVTLANRPRRATW